MPQKQENNKNKIPKKNKFFLGFLIVCFTSIFVLFPIFHAKAQFYNIRVGDQTVADYVSSVFKQLQSDAKTLEGDKKWQEKLSGIFIGVVKNALKKIAMDTATWLGSGGKGQKPQFVTEGWGAYLSNIGDEAAGEFLETLGKTNDWGEFNLCNPDFALKLKIGLGLKQNVRPSAPNCTFSKMVKNWETELNNPDFLPNFQDMFNPTSNDFGIALTLQSKVIEDKEKKLQAKSSARVEEQGWLNVRDIAGMTTQIPGVQKLYTEKSIEGFFNDMGKVTKNIVEDTVNVFINQLAITYMRTLLTKSMAGDSSTNEYSEWDSLFNEEAAPTMGGGVAGMKARIQKIVKPDFTVRGDYNILAELAVCPNPSKAGPTNCVISDKLSEAVSDRKLVGEALKDGYLNSQGIFGFNADGSEPPYNEGYPYRSMIILRKYRIIPVGWEIAAQYIKEKQKENTSPPFGMKSLNDMVACFDPEDDYKGYNDTGAEDWCEGLVDPTWVLKAPLNYCKKEGPGPEIIMEQISGSGVSSKLNINRNDKYCADEQACIKERDNGTCEAYGYCTEERRKWKFDSASCDPLYNTCQTFRSRQGKTVSYLENTLDYGGCSANDVGCKWYCASAGGLNFGTKYIPAGYLSYWDFEDGTGSPVLSDKSENNYDGDLININTTSGWVPSRTGLGTSLIFNKADEEYVNIGNVNFSSNNISVMAWVKTSYNAAVSEDIMAGNDNNILFGIIDGKVLFGQQWTANGLTGSKVINDGSWHHVAAVYDGTNISLYVDGIADGTGPPASLMDFMTAADKAIYIGGTPKNNLEYFNGQIDEAYIYNTILTGTEIQNYYNEWSSVNVSSVGWACNSSVGNKLYFNKNVETCKAENAGCNEYIRTKPGVGSNLLQNSSFELDENSAEIADTFKDDGTIDNFYFWGGIGNSSKTSYDGLTGLQPVGDIDRMITVGPENYYIGGETYTLSFFAKDCGTTGTTTLASSTAKLVTTSNWQQFRLSTFISTSVTENSINIKIEGFTPSCVIDAIKLERGAGTNYNAYRQSGLIYEKVIPDYLESSCYRNITGEDYELSSSAAPECSKFARKCNRYEVGCEMYTSATDGGKTPAKAITQDYCPAECVGYDTFIQKETIFDTLRDSYYIPSTAKKCSAEQRGCDEFTNLDAVAAGGEAKEYYTYLKQCMKPSTADCTEFYTWEGSDEAGYQLKVFSLKKNGSDPFLTNTGSYNDLLCDKPSYNLSTNPECREFYNTSGSVSYRFLPYTITCSDNCKPYRRTENNIEPNIIDKPNCGVGVNAGKSCTDAAFNGDPNIAANAQCWDDAQGVCYFCKNGGAWDSQAFACMYNAIPNEGNKCSAAQNGCREYTGNSGNNTMTVISNNFEGSVQGWIGLGATSITPSSNALMVNGNSLYISGGSFSASTTVGNLVNRGDSYVLSFIAQGKDAAVALNARLDNGTASTTFPGTINIIPFEWRQYQINLSELTTNVSSGESFVLKGNGSFYIDDIVLTEISDRYYLIKNSWVTPEACYKDIFGNEVGPYYNLGCDRYTDRDNATHYLHSFNRLCQDSAVGCELLIDTNNSTDPGRSIFNDGDGNDLCDADEPDCVNTPADNYTYVVYDKKKECNQADKGCQRLGNYYKYENSYLFGDVYFKNNPDKYNSILCGTDSVGCEEWANTDGINYFKDPGDQVCEWRTEFGKATSSIKWYKKRQKRCDDGSNGGSVNGLIDINKTTIPPIPLERNICVSDSDCSLVPSYSSCTKDADCNPASATSETFYNSCVSGKCRYSCVEEILDNPCPISTDKTFGLGGAGGQIEQPTSDTFGYWPGICPAAQAGCTEYIDPESRAGANLVFNGNFSQDIDLVKTNADGWDNAGKTENDSGFKLEPNTLYNLRVRGNNDVTVGVPSNKGNIRELLSGFNILDNGKQTLNIISSNSNYTSKLFYTSSSISDAYVEVDNALKKNGSEVEIKKIILDYQIKKDIDKTACDGVYNYEEGCILFNERAVSGINLAKLVYDTDRTGSRLPPFAPNPADATVDSNALIKVAPDRVCNKWLACRDKMQTAKENICLGVGICDKFNYGGGCGRFVDNIKIDDPKIMQVYPTNTEDIKNKTGYVKISYNILNNANYNYGNKTFPHYNDYYKFGEMQTENVSGNLLNWGFEDAIDVDTTKDGDNDIPRLGWTCDIDASSNNVCEVIDDPVENQAENICFKKEDKNCNFYSPEGRNFLKISNKGTASYSVNTMPGYEIFVAKNREYTLSAYINTKKMSDGKPKLSILGFTEQGAGLVTNNGITRLLAQEPGELDSYEVPNPDEERENWRLITRDFTTGVNTTAIRIKLSFTDGASGSYYIDDVKLKPVLKSRDNWKTLQSCRLYPEKESMACDYYAESGIRYKGWSGYCLEYDRYPGSYNACLLWWPTPDGDRIAEFCGNGAVDGEEDCDCGKDDNGTPADLTDDKIIYDCYNGMLVNGAPNNLANPFDTDTPNPYGSHQNNQYRCSYCTWAGGWCGDGDIQAETNSEHCDWNDVDASKPNIKESECWSDHSKLEDHYAGPPEHDVTNDFAHPGKVAPFTDYLYGSLGCYNNSNAARRCRFDVSGCSDNLVNNARTRRDCVVAGGKVVNKDGVEVTDGNGNITDRSLVGDRSGSNGPFFCKFENIFIDIDCGDDIVADDINNYCSSKGMSAYLNWSAGQGQRCQGEDEFGCTPCQCPISCEDTNECQSSNFSWQNIQLQIPDEDGSNSTSCSYYNATVDDCTCGKDYQTNHPDIIAVGCY